MQRFISITLSVISGIGGHFVNHRWDRAILFFSLFILWVTASSTFLFFLSIKRMIGEPAIYSLPFYENTHLYIGVGILTLWVASIVVTIFDSRFVKKPFNIGWTVSGVIGSVCMSLMTFAVIAGMILFLIYSRSTELDDPLIVKHKELDDTNFQRDVKFGGYDWKRKNYSDLPTGDAYIVGKFLFDDKPASGIKIKLWLNGEYETDFLTTDESGKFIIKVPEGPWYFNRLETFSWKNKPTNDPGLIVSGQEDKLRGNEYRRVNWFEKKGYLVESRSSLQNESIIFKVNPKIEMVWPSGNQIKLSASINKSIIKWRPYKGATDYLVKILEVEREGNTTSYHSLAAKRVTNASELALSHFKTSSGDSEEKEYQVIVYAFDLDGSFLSESNSHFYSNSTFKLTDGNVILNEIYASRYSSEYTSEEIKELSNNNNRLTAVQVLIKDNMFLEAETLLGRMKGISPPGKKEAIAGYLAAMKGDCKEAKRLFLLAEVKNPEVCIPKFYKSNCE